MSSAQIPDLPVRFTGNVETEKLRIIKKAARAFIRELSSHVPKFSGQARGSMLPLAAEVGTQLKGGPMPLSLGRAVPAGQSFASGRDLEVHELDSNHFMWETLVPYFARHDINWKAIEQAELAAEAVFEEEFKIFTGRLFNG